LWRQAKEENAVKSIICGLIFAALVSPALADKHEYWVEYNYSTHMCSVVEKEAQEPAAGTAQAPTTADTTNGGNTSDATQGASAADTAARNLAAMLDASDGADAHNTATAARIQAWIAERKAASGAPNAAASSDGTQGADAANTVKEGGASPAPDTPTTVDATQGADAANTTTEGGVSGTLNAATASGAPTSAGTGDDPFKDLAASWARKKAAAEAAGTDTTKALIGTAMHSRKEAESEMQVLRQCGLYTH
jgi:hypothetical protein